MTHEPSQEIIDRLDMLLDAERTALLQGKLDQVAKLVGEKENLIDALNARDTDNGADLSFLRDKVARNQALLDGALQGIRNVAARIAAFRRIRRSAGRPAGPRRP